MYIKSARQYSLTLGSKQFEWWVNFQYLIYVWTFCDWYIRWHRCPELGHFKHKQKTLIKVIYTKVEQVGTLDQEYIDRAREIFLLSFSCFIQQLLMTLINLSGKFKFKAMIWTHWQPPYRRRCWASVFKGILGLLIRCLWLALSAIEIDNELTLSAKEIVISMLYSELHP